MKEFFLTTLFVFASSFFCYGQKTLPKNFVGVFQWCPFHCETVKLNADFTFEYFVYGDMRNGRLKGTWKLLNAKKIRLKGKDEYMYKIVKDFEKEGVAFEPAYPAEIDLTLFLKSGELCNFDKKVEIGYCMKKLEKEDADKLFPPVKSNE